MQIKVSNNSERKEIKKNCSYLAHFSDRPQKIYPSKNSLYLRNSKFLVLILKISYIFSKESFYYISGSETLKKVFLFLEMEIPKKFLVFQQTERSYNSGKEAFLYFRKGIFRILAYLELEACSELRNI